MLFLLIGLLGVAFLAADPVRLAIGALCIPLVLAARAISVALPMPLWRRLMPVKTAFPLMVWGGLRGGLSLAMALALPTGPNKELIVTIAYVVVLLSVLVQSLTVRRALV